MNTPSTRSSTDRDSQPLTVVRVGGSLLDLPDLAGRVCQAVSGLSVPLVVTGGGAAADQVRSWHQHGLVDGRQAHWLAIAAMTQNGHRLISANGRFLWAETPSQARQLASQGHIPVLDTFTALRMEETERQSVDCLPASWDVTSDSIAAWLAVCWQADLWLLKSVHAGPSPSTAVDAWFDRASEGLSACVWLNLRDSQPRPEWLQLPLSAAATRSPENC